MKKINLKLLFRLSSLLLLLSLLNCAENASSNEPYSKAVISFTGDIMMHNNVKRCAYLLRNEENNMGFAYLFKHVKNILSSSDITCGNMEFPVNPPFRSKGIIFNSPPHIVPALKNSGFDILTLSNNHITDQKTEGLLYTLSLLEKENMPYIGVSRNNQKDKLYKIIEINGIKVSFAAYTGLLNYHWRRKSDKYYINWFHNKKTLKKDIEFLKNNSDFLVLQIHYGTEYVLAPSAKIKELYRQAAEFGADVIIGHHPHTIQSMEQYTTSKGRKVNIFYSLGNFISDQKRSVKIKNSNQYISIKSSFIISMELIKNYSNDQFTIDQTFTITPVYTENIAARKNGKHYRDIQVKLISKELKKLNSNLVESNTKQKSKIRSKIKYLEYQEKSIHKVLFPKKQPSNIQFKWSNI